MTDISASEARQKFGEILRRASTGEQFIIVREGYPVASLGPASGLSWNPEQARAHIIDQPTETQMDVPIATSPTVRPVSRKEPTRGDLPERPSPWELKYGKGKK